MSDNQKRNSIPGGQEIGKKLKDVIINRQKDLQEIYGRTEQELDKSLGVPIKKGEEMARKLIEDMGCPPEVATELTVLTLYDVAILIGTYGASVHSSEIGSIGSLIVEWMDR